MSYVQKLVDDFENNKRYGTLKLEFRAGELVFVRREDTLIPPSQEKNSVEATRSTNGTYDRKRNEAI